MKLKMKKGILLVLVMLLTLCMLLPEAAVTAPGDGYLTITKLLTGSTTDLSQPATNLVDGDPGTYWGIKPGSHEGLAKAVLPQPSLIHGIMVNGELAEGTVLVAEYQRDNQWIPFCMGHLSKLPTGGTIDLSWDKAVTSEIRLRLTGANVPQTRLTEIKIMGYAAEQVFHRIQPEKIIASPNTLPTSPAEFLTDRNTYTIWQTNPGKGHHNYLDWDLDYFLNNRYFDSWMDSKPRSGWNHCQIPSRGEVIFDLGGSYHIQSMNIFFTQNTTGGLHILVPSGNGWRQAGEVAKQPAGWYRLNLNAQTVITDCVKVIAGGDRQGAGGISEIEIWGIGKYEGKRRQPLIYGPETITKPLNRHFILPENELKGNSLELSYEGGSSDPVTVDLNEATLTLQPTLQTNGFTIYNLPLDETILRPGLNFIRINPQSQVAKLLTASLVKRNPVGEVDLTTGPEIILNDGLLLAAGNNSTQFNLNLRQAALVEAIEIYLKDEGTLKLYAGVKNNWVSLEQSQSKPGFIQFTGPEAVVRQLRIENPSGVNITEVRVLGSPVTDQAPVVKILWPRDGDVLDIGEWGHRDLVGFVDNPDAGVLVNGEQVYQNGHYFGMDLKKLHVKTWEAAQLTAIARDPQGRESRDEVEFTVGEMPLVTLNQPGQLIYTDKDSFQISGWVRLPFSKVTVNGTPVKVTGQRFNTSVNLQEGYNLITVCCTFSIAHGKKQFFSQIKREVVRCTEPLQLTINNPLPETYLNTKNVIVDGTVTGLQPCKVTVNGSTAQVEGNFYRASITLVEGKNIITVKASDANGVVVTKTLTVTCDTKLPVISNLVPAEGFIANTQTIKVTGTISDTSPVVVYVNGRPASLNGTGFESEVSFDDGRRQITIQAQDLAGNVSQKTITIITDTTPPLDFEVTVNPADWTNNNRPMVTFGATDLTSGIDHYELAVDDQSFTKVTSPYRLPALQDGERLITVKAVDKAGWETTSTAHAYIDTTPPVAPAEFKAVPGDKKIIVSWKPNPETDLKKYIVKRIPAFPSGDEKEFGPEIHEYIDTEVQDGTGYSYSIKAGDHIDNIGQVSTAPAVKPGVAEVKVNPAVETKIEYENVIVGVPEKALTREKTLTIMEVKDPEPLLEKSLALNISKVYEFGAQTSQGTVDPAGVRFEKPVLVGIHYELNEAQKKYLKETNFRAYYYNYKDENWEVIPESYVNPETDTVYFFTNHFSTLSVQASVAPQLAPEQISSMGVAPGKEYNQNHQVGVAYGSGCSTVTAKDFVLPGRGGLDLTISRSYDNQTAQADWGLDEDNVFSAMFSFLDFGDPFFNFLANMVSQQIDRYMARLKDCYGFGRGWRLNFVWVENNDNGQFVHLPGGGMKKINWTMDGPGWDGQGHGRFECHAGEHFTLEKFQTKQGDIYSQTGPEGQPVKVGENWATHQYILTTREGAKYYMNGDGHLLRIVNRLGASEITFHYQSDGKKIDYILDSVGRKIQFSYSGDMISSITAAGKTVTYSYNNDELAAVNDGGIWQTRYNYGAYTIKSGSQTVSAVNIITSILTQNWIGLIAGLLPSNREDTVYYLTSVTTPFGGEYRFEYTSYAAMRYATGFLSISTMWYEFYKVTRFRELGSSHNKDTRIEYTIVYSNDQAPEVAECNIYEGKRRTYMMFERYSNSVDKDTMMMTNQVIYGEHDRIISSHTITDFDRELEVPLKVVDQTGGRNTVQEFKYDNWGNLIWQRNSKTKVEAFYSYANTSAPTISHASAKASPFENRSISGDIHDAKIGELVLNQNGPNVIPQQTWYNYDANGNLLEKAVRYGTEWLVSSYEYDSYGNIVKMRSPSGIETIYEYSGKYNHALLTKVTLKQLTDANGNIATNVTLKEMGYEPVTFRKRWEKDARGYVTEYRQDVLGREIKTVLPDDDDARDYYPEALAGDIEQNGARSNNPSQSTIFKDGERTSTIIDPMGNRTDYIYDTFEHLVEIQKYKRILGIPYVYSKVKVGYDEQGNIVKIVSPNGAANPSEEYKYTTWYQYDEVNRLQKVTYPDGTETPDDNPYKFYEYNDDLNTVTVTDENGNQSMTKKDEVGRVVEQALGLHSESMITNYFGYDSLGNKISETDGRGNTVLFVYDDLNRLVSKTLPATEILNNPDSLPTVKSPRYTYEYDREGNVIKEISPLGTVVT
ncbi:MAG: hypothetical protein K6U80_18605, partial [Firmicutes bacterium]|nr:hypothetical protein [Bacillota bacterium]